MVRPNHQTARRLARYPDAEAFCNLLSCKARAEVKIMIPREPEYLCQKGLVKAPIAGTSATGGEVIFCSIAPQLAQQPKFLPAARCKQQENFAHMQITTTNMLHLSSYESSFCLMCNTANADTPNQREEHAIGDNPV